MSSNEGLIISTKEKPCKFILKKRVGDFDEGELKGALMTTASGAPMVEFENGNAVVFPWEWLVGKAFEALEEE